MAVRVFLIEADTTDEIRELATSMNLKIWSQGGNSIQTIDPASSKTSSKSDDSQAADLKLAKKIKRHKEWTAIHEEEREANPDAGITELLRLTTDRINIENERNIDHDDVSTSTVRRVLNERYD